MLAEGVGELALGVFHPVTLVDHDVLPGKLLQQVPVFQDVFVGGEADVPLAVFERIGHVFPE